MDRSDSQPDLVTARLRLRPFRLSDASDVRNLAGDSRIASTTMNIPHPYLEGMAEAWIGGHVPRFRQGKGASFAIVLADHTLVGCIGLQIDPKGPAELGYWIGAPYWGNGYATEAGWAVLEYASRQFAPIEIEARHFIDNPSSGKILDKLGFQRDHLLEKVRRGDGSEMDAVVHRIAFGSGNAVAHDQY